MLLPETDAIAAQGVAERARQGVVDLAISHQFSRVAEYVSVSIGLATTIIDGSIPQHSFVTTADRNLYLAKEQGRNRIVGSMVG
jgi:diguanylate cyclase (GGDEF)-like protein